MINVPSDINNSGRLGSPSQICSEPVRFSTVDGVAVLVTASHRPGTSRSRCVARLPKVFFYSSCFLSLPEGTAIASRSVPRWDRIPRERQVKGYTLHCRLVLPENMTTEEKFNAAVNVIRSLPKNGKGVRPRYRPCYRGRVAARPESANAYPESELSCAYITFALHSRIHSNITSHTLTSLLHSPGNAADIAALMQSVFAFHACWFLFLSRLLPFSFFLRACSFNACWLKSTRRQLPIFVVLLRNGSCIYSRWRKSDNGWCEALFSTSSEALEKLTPKICINVFERKTFERRQ